MIVWILPRTEFKLMATRDILLGPVQQCTERHGAYLIDLIIRGNRGKQVLEVFVDNETGVTADLCGKISRSITEALDGAGVLLGSYRLDVSSPGIDRALRFPWQFRKHIGRVVDVSVSNESGTRRETGKLLSCDEAALVVEAGEGKPQIRIPLTEVNELRVNAPW
jgi:ribosome maturation factor RimP